MQESCNKGCGNCSRKRNEKTDSTRKPSYNPKAKEHLLMQKSKEERYRQIHANISRYPYYTPFFAQIQAFLAKKAFFVDYDG